MPACCVAGAACIHGGIAPSVHKCVLCKRNIHIKCASKYKTSIGDVFICPSFKIPDRSND